ncbi:type II toxin-antitoxin system VapB family antitoxin [Thiotrichales bacterium 19S9-12]|nr:type II toxin-antitoxin system VapB family antitoxin [Thiotrichales bacterium 19S9-11]MCF6812275.1 type II toxin-antitoxin system VapB family antitoxin [Thiotrichales bacterium 19S9-12]
MQSTVFKSGNSQAIRIPKKLNVNSKKVDIKKVGNALIIKEISHKKGWDEVFQCLNDFEDFMTEGRVDLPVQEREGFK